MFQLPVSFQIYVVFKNTWENWGNYLVSKKNCGIPYSFLPSLLVRGDQGNDF
jgi:hypothetical protein